MKQAMRITICLIALCGILIHSWATSPDSLRRQRRVLITPRFNTANMAPVSGTLINRHWNFDITVQYIRDRFMLTFVNAVDLEDQQSEMNYFLINARYRLRLNDNFSISPFLAFYSEHAHRLFDVGSDANAGMIFGYQQNSLSIEAFALLVRVTHQTQSKDAINRLEIKYRFPTVTLSGFIYHNARYFDNKERVCIGFRGQLPTFPVSKKLRARTDVTGSFKVYEAPKTGALSGVFLSLVLLQDN